MLDDAVDLQFTIWGYAVTGDVCETSALIAEHQHVPAVWDRTIENLGEMWVAYGDEPYHHPPEWWLLPAVADLIVRGLDDPNVRLLRPLGAR